MRTPLTPDLVSESPKGQGDHSMWGRPRTGKSPIPGSVSARCVWQELYCPNSSPPVFVHRPRRKVTIDVQIKNETPRPAATRTERPISLKHYLTSYSSRRDQGVTTLRYWASSSIYPGGPSIRGDKGRTECLTTSHLTSQQTRDRLPRGTYPLNGDRASILLNVAPVMGMAEGRRATGAHMPYRRRYKAPVTGTESPTAWEEGKQPTSHHVIRQRGLC